MRIKEFVRAARPYLAGLWLLFLGGSLLFFFTHRDFFHDQLQQLVGAPLYIAYAAFLLLGLVRGFTLIPVTYLIILGLPFFPPVPLFVAVMAGVLVSSASVYYFFEYLDLDAYFEKKHHQQIARLRASLAKNELPIVIAWSAFPLLPTDAICYVCGTLDVDIKKCLVGVLIGEGLTCAIYIFLGQHVLGALRLAL